MLPGAICMPALVSVTALGVQPTLTKYAVVPDNPIGRRAFVYAPEPRHPRAVGSPPVRAVTV